MNAPNNKLIITFLIILIITSFVNLWIALNKRDKQQTSSLQRDSLIQIKIDSLQLSLYNFRELYSNDRLLADKEQKIIYNYINYSKKKDELFKNPADSIYNWTKHKLNLRTR